LEKRKAVHDYLKARTEMKEKKRERNLAQSRKETRKKEKLCGSGSYIKKKKEKTNNGGGLK